jgi:glycosyltransferase involved in cell wall biosynthesis
MQPCAKCPTWTGTRGAEGSRPLGKHATLRSGLLSGAHRSFHATTRGGLLIDILYVGGLAPPHRGGSGILGTELVTGLTRLGHRLRALTPRPAASTSTCARFEARHPEVETTWFPIPVASSELLEGSRDAGYRQAEDAGVRLELPRLIADRRPDVILIGRESVVAEVPPVALRHGIPTVVLVQGGRALRKMVDGDPDPLACHQRERVRQVDVVVAIARHIQRALAPLSLRRVAVVPNPVDLERFSPGEKPPDLLRCHGIHPHDVVIAHLSNLGPLKRPMDVIESAARVLAASPDFVYLIVGDGPYRARMEARCRELGIAQRLRFVGWVEHSEVPAYLRVADIVVMPSEREGLPLVYLETQASGRLLVASDIPATREVVVDGETGLIARCGDVADLAAKILLGARDPALRAAIGRAARAGAHAHAKPAILATYVAIMEQLAASRGPAAPCWRGAPYSTMRRASSTTTSGPASGS